jgi:AraC-like DNA-binding protein
MGRCDLVVHVVLRDTRCLKAEALLANGGRGVAAIAHKLEYSEHGVVTQAAIRWFGAPPSGDALIGAGTVTEISASFPPSPLRRRAPDALNPRRPLRPPL